MCLHYYSQMSSSSSSSTDWKTPITDGLTRWATDEQQRIQQGLEPSMIGLPAPIESEEDDGRGLTAAEIASWSVYSVASRFARFHPLISSNDVLVE